jgi:CRISPR-associated protein Csh2
MAEVKNRSEILFLYDIENANPNGDPNDENKPRIDEETGKNIVTDVRLKRTVRDYLLEKGDEIFIKEVRREDGKLKTKEDRTSDLDIKNKEDMVSKCIDVRLFGVTSAIKGKTITLTGPVQFKMGKSLHSVKGPVFVKGTTVMPSKEGLGQGTMTETYILPYSLIAFCGVINENAAKYTKLTTEDIGLLKEAIWKGTQGLISRSKYGQMPRLLLVINYSEPNFFIGDLDNLIQLSKGNLRDEELRKPEDYKVEIGKLLEKVRGNKEKIDNIKFITDSRMQYLDNGSSIELKSIEKFQEIAF